MRPVPLPAGPGQESVWDFPRPPRLEPCDKTLRVVVSGRAIAETSRGLRLLETSHPPTYYFPPADVDFGVLVPGRGRSFCEYKGFASYYDLVIDGTRIDQLAWAYAEPTGAYRTLTGHLAFYCTKADECRVGDERATPQPGGFYGGWVTASVVGPFKGGPGSMGW